MELLNIPNIRRQTLAQTWEVVFLKVDFWVGSVALVKWFRGAVWIRPRRSSSRHCLWTRTQTSPSWQVSPWFWLLILVTTDPSTSVWFPKPASYSTAPSQINTETQVSGWISFRQTWVVRFFPHGRSFKSSRHLLRAFYLPGTGQGAFIHLVYLQNILEELLPAPFCK